MYSNERLNHFRFWCQKVLPLVYDNSLSYYEVLCKVTEYLNNIIDGVEIQQETIDKMLGDISDMQKELEKISSGDFDFVYQVIANAIKNVFFGLTLSGYFVAYIPEGWDDITFETSGYDTIIPEVSYGHLILSY